MTFKEIEMLRLKTKPSDWYELNHMKRKSARKGAGRCEQRFYV